MLRILKSENYVAPYSPLHFLTLSAATFLFFSVTTTQAIFPIVMANAGISEIVAGYALAATGVSVLIFGIISGSLISKFGPLKLVLSGLIVTIAAHVAFDLVPLNAGTVIATRLVYGIGVGLYLPATIAFSTSMLAEPNRTFLFGVFTTAILGANLAGPPFGEYFLSEFGAERFFLITALPGIAAGLIYFALAQRLRGRVTTYQGRQGYFGLMRRIDLRQPLLGMFIIGSLWGFIVSFAAVALLEKNLTVANFFVSMTIGIVAGRYIVLGLVQHQPRNRTVALSLSFCTLSLAALAVLPSTPILATIVGAVFGTGYSLTYPILVVWVTNLFDGPERAPAIALSNTVFSFFMYLAPALCAVALRFIPILHYQLALTILLFMFTVAFWLWPIQRLNSGSSADRSHKNPRRTR